MLQEVSRSGPSLRNYACSMPKFGATGSKTDQLEFANMQVFRGFSRSQLVGVSARIALITRRSGSPAALPKVLGFQYRSYR